jgi:hypothetical protein
MKNEYNVPKLTLSDLYDENIVYNSRPSYAFNSSPIRAIIFAPRIKA